MVAVGMSNGVLTLFELPNHMVAEDDDYDAALFEIGAMRRRKRAWEASMNHDSFEDLLDDSIPVTPFTDLTLLHILSITKGPLSTVSFSETVDWVGLSSATDQNNSKNLSSGVHEVHTIEDDEEDTEGKWETQLADGKSLPGTPAEEKLRRKRLMKAEVTCARASVTGGLWAAVSIEGVMVFGDVEDDGYGEALFDPTNLDVDITPHAAAAAVQKRDYVMATVIALRLNERVCLNGVINQIPLENIQGVVTALPVLYLPRLIHLLSWLLEHTPQLELNLLWARKLMPTHGASSLATAMRVLRKACYSRAKRLRPLINKNEHIMHYVRNLASRNRNQLTTEQVMGT